ncbi:MAG: acyl-CoA dehydrogenase family protein [Alphaproteobacteria bacterium]
MDFTDTAEEATYRATVRAFLDANAEKKEPGKQFKAGYGEDNLVPLAKDWQAKKHAAGFAGITMPTEYGGQGGSQMQQVIYNQEEQNYLVPRGAYEIGLGMCIPTMLTYATEEQKQRFAPPALRGEEIWCQLFSEPVGGSDVANAKTRAVPDGDDWIINGSKIWTSGAHFSDWGIMVLRTDPTVPKHKGMSFFFLDMKSPGIEVRRIKQISGTSNFNEVFFEDVRVPDSQRLGAVGEGWRVALTTLMNERLAVGQAPPPDFEEIFAFVRSIELDTGPAIQDSSVREKLADWYVESQGLKLSVFRTMTALSRGETPGPENSINKIISANKRQDIANFAVDLMEQAGIAMGADSPMAGIFQEAVLSSPSGRVAGGTDEILRNIIAERVLGLPQDIRVDKDVPYNQLQQGR